MTLTYAGVPLCVPTPEIEAWIEQWIPDKGQFQDSVWPGPPLSSRPLAWESYPDFVAGHDRLNTLVWPRGGQRWAKGFFLVGQSGLVSIQAALTASSVVGRALLHMDDGNGGTIETQMWCLPPRPIADKSLYVLPLVDSRFWLWATEDSALYISPGDDWPTLLARLKTDVVFAGEDLQYSTIASVYTALAGETAQWNLFGPVETPIQVDAIAYNLGMRVVRDLNGTYHLLSLTDSKARKATNLAAGFRPLAGGARDLNAASTTNFLNELVPSAVSVFVPILAPSSDLIVAHWNYDHTLTSLGLSSFQGITGVDGFKSIHMPYMYVYATDINNASVTAKVTQIAQDWYGHQIGGRDATYDGLCNWLPEGLSIGIEWNYRPDGCTTRIYAGGLDWEPLPVDKATSIVGEVNGAAAVGPQPILNFKSNSGITWSVVNNSTNSSLDITPTLTAVSSPSVKVQNGNGLVYGPEPTISVGATNVVVTVSDDTAGGRILLGLNISTLTNVTLQSSTSTNELEITPTISGGTATNVVINTSTVNNPTIIGATFSGGVNGSGLSTIFDTNTGGQSTSTGAYNYPYSITAPTLTQAGDSFRFEAFGYTDIGGGNVTVQLGSATLVTNGLGGANAFLVRGRAVYDSATGARCVVELIDAGQDLLWVNGSQFGVATPLSVTWSGPPTFKIGLEGVATAGSAHLLDVQVAQEKR